MENLDTNIDPNIPESRDKIVAWVKAVGDKAESQGLEVKSSLEFSTRSERKKSFVKITKFILASANRDQNQAMRDYQGYGVMLIGVTKDEICGLENIPEQHEFEGAIRSYFGSAVPKYRFVTHTFEGKDLLFVIVDPPVNGQEIYICSGSYDADKRVDQLRDGAIYCRESTQTIEANSVQVRDMINRLLGGNVTVYMNASSFYRVSRIDTDVLKDLYHEPKKKYVESIERMYEDRKNNKTESKYHYEANFYNPSSWGAPEVLENYEIRLEECFEGLLKKNLPSTILSIKNDGTKALKNPRIEYSFLSDICLVNLDGAEKLMSYDIFPFLPIPEREYFDFESSRPILSPEEPHLSSKFSKGSKPGVIIWKPGPVNPGEIITSREDNVGILMVGDNDVLAIRYSITDSNLQRPINGEIYANNVELKNITDLLKVVTFPEYKKISIPF
mgnify:CR=1 FL=1